MKDLIKKINKAQRHYWLKAFQGKKTRGLLRWVLGIVVCILFILIACIGREPAIYNYHEGDIARKDITADIDVRFDIVDTARTDLLRREAEERVNAVYDINVGAIEDGE